MKIFGIVKRIEIKGREKNSFDKFFCHWILFSIILIKFFLLFCFFCCRWYKFIEGTTRRQPVQLNERVRQVSGTLIIREARVEDSGKYLCIVNNSVGGESVETVLTVTAPLGSEIEPRTQTVDFGRPATFTCNVRGNPIKTISWMKDGKPLGHEDAVLRIESVKKEDKGMYQCFVRNDQESAQSTAELKLGGRCK